MKKNAYGWCGAAAALAWGLSLGAADYSRMTVDVSALPPEKAFLGDIVLRRAQDRTVFSEKTGTLAVAFRLDDSLKGDDAAVTVRDGRAVVRAGAGGSSASARSSTARGEVCPKPRRCVNG